MASINWVKRVTLDGITESWTAHFSNGTQETYSGEIPPQNVARFCRMARYGYKDMYGDYLGEVMIDWYSKKPLTTSERTV